MLMACLLNEFILLMAFIMQFQSKKNIIYYFPRAGTVLFFGLRLLSCETRHVKTLQTEFNIILPQSYNATDCDPQDYHASLVARRAPLCSFNVPATGKLVAFVNLGNVQRYSRTDVEGSCLELAPMLITVVQYRFAEDGPLCGGIRCEDAKGKLLILKIKCF